MSKDLLKELRRHVRYLQKKEGLLSNDPSVMRLQKAADEIERLRDGILGITMDAKHMEPEDIESDLQELLDGKNDD